MLEPVRDLTWCGRVRAFAVWQLPTTLFVAYIVSVVTVVNPAEASSPGVVGAAVAVVVATVSALVVRWDVIGAQARIVVPALSLAAAVSLRVELLGVLPSIGVVSVLPIVWLAFDFGALGVSVAITGACSLTALPYLVDRDLPIDAMAWLQTTLLPVMAIGLALVMRLVAGRLAEHDRHTQHAREGLRDALALAERRLAISQHVLEALDAAVLFYDHTGDLILANTTAYELGRLAGANPPDPSLPAKAASAVYEEDRTTPVRPEDQVIIRTAVRGEDVDARLYWIGHPGAQRAIVMSGRQIYDQAHNHLGAVVAAWDVTDLRNAIAVRDAFLSTVSHELRTPLTPIIGHLDLLADDLADDFEDPQFAAAHPAAARALRSAQRNAEILAGRINDLLTESRADVRTETGPGHGWLRELADLSQLVEATLQACLALDGPGAPEHAVTVDVEPGLRATIDAPRIGQAITQLCSNAVKYTPAPGHITATFRRFRDVADDAANDAASGDGETPPATSDAHVPAQVAVLTISDSGVGMRPDELTQAFDRFYRTSYAHDAAIQGIGLGLSTVRRIIDDHHGTIRLHSPATHHPDHLAGTTVVVTLPLAADPRPGLSPGR